MSRGVRGLEPPRSPPAPCPVQSDQLDEGETGPLLGGPPSCRPLWRPDSQPLPADIQPSEPRPALLGPHWEHLLPGPQAPTMLLPLQPPSGEGAGWSPQQFWGTRRVHGHRIGSISGIPGPGEDLAGPGRAACTAYHPQPSGIGLDGPLPDLALGLPWGPGRTQHPLPAEANPRHALQMGPGGTAAWVHRGPRRAGTHSYLSNPSPAQRASRTPMTD